MMRAKREFVQQSQPHVGESLQWQLAMTAVAVVASDGKVALMYKVMLLMPRLMMKKKEKKKKSMHSLRRMERQCFSTQLKMDRPMQKRVQGQGDACLSKEKEENKKRV